MSLSIKDFARRGWYGREEVVGKNGIVVAKRPAAAEAGIRIMKKGGNAIDAAVATGFAIGVVEPMNSQIGGVGWLNAYTAGGEKVMIWAGARAPLKATPDMYELEDEGFGPYFRLVKKDENTEGHLSVGTPGLVAGLCMLHEMYGSLSLEEVMQPAILLAENGYPVCIYDVASISSSMKSMLRYPSMAEIFLSDGYPPRVGSRFTPSTLIVQKDLARTLSLIAKGGADVFYKGEIAEAISKDMELNGGLLSIEDLAKYEPIILKPRPQKYRGFEVLYMPNLNAGPLVMETLNIVEGYDIGDLGHNTPKTLHLISEAMNFAYSDYYEFMGDPDFTDVPLERLLSKNYASDIREQIDPEKVAVNVKKGIQDTYCEEHTTHLCTADRDGNVVSATLTEGGGFGSKVMVPNTGIILNNQMWGFNPEPGHPNSVEPGKCRVAPTTPIIILKSGDPFLTTGAPGGTRIPNCVSQVIMNVLDHRLSIQEAMEAPRIDKGSTIAYGEDTIVDSRIPKTTRKTLKRMGHRLRVVVDIPWIPGGTVNFAVPIGISIDKDKEDLKGGVDPFRPGEAIGY